MAQQHRHPGCEFCADGDLERIAANEFRGTILLRCSRCGAFYEAASDGTRRDRRFGEHGAMTLFPAFAELREAERRG